jgi:hypothetical protein
MLKIDVEGFEFNVLAGASKTLSNRNVLGLIIELNGSGNEYGLTNEEIHEKIINYGFASYSYNPFSRVLTELSDYNKNGGNTIYIRDVELVQIRCKSAPLRILHTANGIEI